MAKDRSKLVKKQIVDKRGKRTSVWVLSNKSLPKKKEGTGLSKMVKSYEKDILNVTKNKYEMAVAFSEDSGVVLQKKGEATQVAFDRDEIAKIKGSAVFTHNHPNSKCFSINDLAIAINSNITQMRAIAEKSVKGNVTWVFEKGEIRGDDDLQRFINEYQSLSTATHNRFRADIYDGIISVKGAELKHHFKVLEGLMSSIYWRSKGAKFYWEKRD